MFKRISKIQEIFTGNLKTINFIFTRSQFSIPSCTLRTCFWTLLLTLLWNKSFRILQTVLWLFPFPLICLVFIAYRLQAWVGYRYNKMVLVVWQWIANAFAVLLLDLLFKFWMRRTRFSLISPHSHPATPKIRSPPQGE